MCQGRRRLWPVPRRWEEGPLDGSCTWPGRRPRWHSLIGAPRVPSAQCGKGLSAVQQGAWGPAPGLCQRQSRRHLFTFRPVRLVAYKHLRPANPLTHNPCTLQVIITPGYGLAVAGGQYAIAELAKALIKKGIRVRCAGQGVSVAWEWCEARSALAV